MENRAKSVEAARKAAAERRKNAPKVEEKSATTKYLAIIGLSIAFYYIVTNLM